MLKMFYFLFCCIVLSVVLFFIVFVFVLILVVDFEIDEQVCQDGVLVIELCVFVEVLECVCGVYVQDVDEKELIQVVICGMLMELDLYFVYLILDQFEDL